MNDRIRIFDGAAHNVGPILSQASGPNGGKQMAWYPVCMRKLYGRGELTRIDLDAPVAPYVTCFWCLSIRS